jgi:beta-phosphoglucomutase-like phosphatase (HAD superfamily)
MNVIFDMDGLMFDTEKVFIKAWDYVGEKIGIGKAGYMSGTSVYNPKHINIVEADFDGIGNELIWCDRKAFLYEQIKRQAEYALWQRYSDKKWIAVRYQK